MTGGDGSESGEGWVGDGSGIDDGRGREWECSGQNKV